MNLRGILPFTPLIPLPLTSLAVGVGRVRLHSPVQPGWSWYHWDDPRSGSQSIGLTSLPSPTQTHPVYSAPEGRLVLRYIRLQLGSSNTRASLIIRICLQADRSVHGNESYENKQFNGNPGWLRVCGVPSPGFAAVAWDTVNTVSMAQDPSFKGSSTDCSGFWYSDYCGSRLWRAARQRYEFTGAVAHLHTMGATQYWILSGSSSATVDLRLRTGCRFAMSVLRMEGAVTDEVGKMIWHRDVAQWYSFFTNRQCGIDWDI
ncbi:hypothetical protein OE88DRAFT_1646404 [Heliocybe sulcata]|uniref:Fibrinogen C-terminal domain-containing protein n=1 Tax=Heliocybe sulcata TaxID=5364 RepID=A0A5C3MYV0_9AGAM|nr:hypothetical protein OE88DRAFT_1646404 [Heliocybe sulcata]